MRDFFADFIDKIKNALKTVAQTNKEYRALQGDIEAKEQILAMFDEALKASDPATKNTTDDSSVKSSVRYTENNIPVAVIDKDILKGVPQNKWVKTVKDTIANNYKNGIPVSGRLVKVNKITKNEITSSKYTRYLKATNGDIYIDKFRSVNNLDDILLASTNYINEQLNHERNDNIKEFARGNVLMRIGNNDYSATVIVAFTSGNNMVLYDLIDFVPTSFGELKRKTDTHTAMQKQEAIENRVPVNNNVPQKDIVVNNYDMQDNVKKSLKDSEGNILSEEQQKFFADSKVRDEDGRLIPVYHGSNAEFTVFDRNRKGQGNDQYGAGFYFGTNTEISDMYGSNTYKSYLNITNPIKVHQAKYEGNNWFDIKITQQQAIEILKRHPLMYDEEESPLGDFYDSYWENGVEDWMIEDLAYKNANIGYLDSNLFRNYPNELHDAIKDVVGYDGIEVTFEGKDEKFYVAWFENQIKLTDNLNPTEDVDIRYSRKERSFSNALSREEWARFYSSISGDTNKNALLIGDNGVMVQDKDDANKYKLVVYEPMEENIDVEAVYLLENYDYNVHDDNENILQNIVIWEKEGRNEKIIRKLLQSYANSFSTVFRKYSRKSGRFVSFTRNKQKLTSKNGTDSSKQSNRTGISERAGEAGKYSRKEKPIDVDKLLEENEELSAMNEQLQEMLAIARKETTITGRHNLSRNFVDNVATYLRQNYGSTYSKRSLSARLDGLYDYIANVIVKLEMDGVNEKFTRKILRAYPFDETTIFRRYNRKSRRFVTVAGYKRNDHSDVGTSSSEQSNRTGISERAGEMLTHQLLHLRKKLTVHTI